MKKTMMNAFFPMTHGASCAAMGSAGMPAASAHAASMNMVLFIDAAILVASSIIILAVLLVLIRITFFYQIPLVEMLV